MQPDRARPAFISPEATPQPGLTRDLNQPASEMFRGISADGPTSAANRAPIDVPDDFPGVVPKFVSRRKAEVLPKLRPVEAAKGFDPSWCRRLAWADWMAGFRWGVVATVGGACLVLALAVGMPK